MKIACIAKSYVSLPKFHFFNFEAKYEVMTASLWCYSKAFSFGDSHANIKYVLKVFMFISGYSIPEAKAPILLARFWHPHNRFIDVADCAFYWYVSILTEYQLVRIPPPIPRSAADLELETDTYSGCIAAQLFEYDDVNLDWLHRGSAVCMLTPILSGQVTQRASTGWRTSATAAQGKRGRCLRRQSTCL